MDCSPPGSSVHGIRQARILEWVDISFSRGSSQPMDFPNPGIEPRSPVLEADALTSEPPTAHFLVFWWWLWTILEPLGVSFSLLIEEKGLIKVDLSAILDPFNSNLFMLCPQAMSFFRKLCPTTTPHHPSFPFQNHWSLRIVEFTCKNLQMSPKALKTVRCTLNLKRHSQSVYWALTTHWENFSIEK